jgi:hypothetical protein
MSQPALFIEESAHEALMQLLRLLSSNQDIRSLTSNHQLIKYKEDLADPLETCFGTSSEIYDNFTKEVTCECCKKYICDWELPCNHHFCLVCLKKETKILKATISALYEDAQYFPKCPICQKVITRQECQRIFKVAKEKSRLKETNNFKLCLFCKLRRPPNKFFYSCDEICIFCGFHLVKFNESCIFCGDNSVKETYANYSQGVKCSVCNQHKNITEDLCTEICKQEVHCYECLRQAWSEGKCLKCGLDLDQATMNYLQQLIFTECKICRNASERNFMIKKNCCQENVCIFCQKQENTCLYCKQNINRSGIRMLDKVRGSYK